METDSDSDYGRGRDLQDFAYNGYSQMIEDEKLARQLAASEESEFHGRRDSSAVQRRCRPQRKTTEKLEPNYYNEARLQFAAELLAAGMAGTSKKQDAVGATKRSGAVRSQKSEAKSYEEDHHGMISIKVPGVELKNGERLPIFHEIADGDKEGGCGNSEPIELVYEEGMAPVPVKICDVTRRAHAPCSVFGPNTKDVIKALHRIDRDYDEVEVLPCAEELYTRLSKNGQAFAKEVLKVSGGGCNDRYVQMMELRDPNDPIVKFQHSEGGKVYGVFARADIPIGTALGLYTGEYRLEEPDGDGATDYDYSSQETRVSERKSTRQKKSGVEERQKTGMKWAHGGMDYDDHSLVSPTRFEGRTHPVSPPDHAANDDDDAGQYSMGLKTHPDAPVKNELYVNSARRANEMSYLNDSRGTGRQENCLYVGVYINGVPAACIVSSAEIKQGDQLFVNYGKDSYWGVREMERQARESAINAKFVVAKQEEKKKRHAEDSIPWEGVIDNQIWQPSAANTGRRPTSFVDRPVSPVDEDLLENFPDWNFDGPDKFVDAQKVCDFVKIVSEASRAQGYIPARGVDESLLHAANNIGEKIDFQEVLVHLGRAASSLTEGFIKWRQELSDRSSVVVCELSDVKSFMSDLTAPGSLVVIQRTREFQKIMKSWEVVCGSKERVTFVSEEERQSLSIRIMAVDMLDPKDPEAREYFLRYMTAHISFLENLGKVLVTRRDAIHADIQKLKFVAQKCQQGKRFKRDL